MTKIIIDKDYCYACNSPIKDSIIRVFFVGNSSGEHFEIKIHYFPPCSTTKLPETWKVLAKSVGYPLYYTMKSYPFLRPRYPNIQKQLQEIDEILCEIN